MRGCRSSHSAVLSTTFRYGLISLLELAGEQELIHASTIAARHNLSQHYLSSVLADLRRLGLVQSQKGKKGGYRLLREPQDVNLLVLYQSLAGSAELAAVDAQEAAADSLKSDQHDLPSTSGAEVWIQALCQRWCQELATTTLADLQVWQQGGLPPFHPQPSAAQGKLP